MALPPRPKPRRDRSNEKYGVVRNITEETEIVFHSAVRIRATRLFMDVARRATRVCLYCKQAFGRLTRKCESRVPMRRAVLTPPPENPLTRFFQGRLGRSALASPNHPPPLCPPHGGAPRRNKRVWADTACGCHKPACRQSFADELTPNGNYGVLRMFTDVYGGGFHSPHRCSCLTFVLMLRFLRNIPYFSVFPACVSRGRLHTRQRISSFIFHLSSFITHHSSTARRAAR